MKEIFYNLKLLVKSILKNFFKLMREIEVTMIIDILNLNRMIGI